MIDRLLEIEGCSLTLSPLDHCSHRSLDDWMHSILWEHASMIIRDTFVSFAVTHFNGLSPLEWQDLVQRELLPYFDGDSSESWLSFTYERDLSIVAVRSRVIDLTGSSSSLDLIGMNTVSPSSSSSSSLGTTKKHTDEDASHFSTSDQMAYVLRIEEESLSCLTCFPRLLCHRDQRAIGKFLKNHKVLSFSTSLRNSESVFRSLDGSVTSALASVFHRCICQRFLRQIFSKAEFHPKH